jgi:hypothetical protein
MNYRHFFGITLEWGEPEGMAGGGMAVKNYPIGG